MLRTFLALALVSIAVWDAPIAIAQGRWSAEGREIVDYIGGGENTGRNTTINQQWTEPLCIEGVLSNSERLNCIEPGVWAPFNERFPILPNIGGECRLSLSSNGVLSASFAQMPDTIQHGNGYIVTHFELQQLINLNSGAINRRHSQFSRIYSRPFMPHSDELVRDAQYNIYRSSANGYLTNPGSFCPISELGNPGRDISSCPSNSGSGETPEFYAVLDPDPFRPIYAHDFTTAYLTQHAAHAIAADGAAWVALVVRVNANSGPVTISLGDSPGALFPWRDGMVNAPDGEGAASLTIYPESWVDAGCTQTSSDADRLALAVYRAPEVDEAFPHGARNVSAFIQVTIGNSAGPYQILDIEYPPIAFVHGLWGDGNALRNFERILSTGALVTQWYRMPQTHHVQYNGNEAFDDPSNLATVQSQLDQLVMSTRVGGVAVSEVDVIAHSMGGLVARNLILLNEQADFIGDIGVGINRLVTLNSPFSGSPFADVLLQNRNSVLDFTRNESCMRQVYMEEFVDHPIRSLFKLFLVGFGLPDENSTVEEYLTSNEMPISGGVASLVTDNQNLEVINDLIEFRHFGVTGSASEISPLELQMQALMCAANLRSEQFFLTVDELLGNGHDGIVPYISQSGGAGELRHFNFTTHNFSLLEEEFPNIDLRYDNNAVYNSIEVAICVFGYLSGEDENCFGADVPPIVNSPRSERASVSSSQGNVSPILTNAFVEVEPPNAGVGEQILITGSVDDGSIADAEFVLIPGSGLVDGIRMVEGVRATDNSYIARYVLNEPGNWRIAAVFTRNDNTTSVGITEISVDSVDGLVALQAEDLVLSAEGPGGRPQVEGLLAALPDWVSVDDLADLSISPSSNPAAVIEDGVVIPLRAGRSSALARVGEFEAFFDVIVGRDALPERTPLLRSAILPGSRTYQLGSNAPATAFASIVNASDFDATGCTVGWPNSGWSDFLYQLTDPTTNVPRGVQNPVFDIPARGLQTLVFSVAPEDQLPDTGVFVDFSCDNTFATTTPGVNNFLLAVTDAPTSDLVSIAQTSSFDGVLRMPGADRVGAFGVAAINIGVAEQINVSARTTGEAENYTVSLCRSDPATGTCVTDRAESLQFEFGSGTVGTFSVFVRGDGDTVNFSPARNRVFFEFMSIDGSPRGSASVAILAQ